MTNFTLSLYPRIFYNHYSDLVLMFVFFFLRFGFKLHEKKSIYFKFCNFSQLSMQFIIIMYISDIATFITNVKILDTIVTQGSKGIRQWPINLYYYMPNDKTQNYPFCRLQLVVETFLKLSSQRIRKLHIKTLGNNVINSLMTTPSLIETRPYQKIKYPFHSATSLANKPQAC